MASWSDQDIRLNGTSLKSYAYGIAVLGTMDSRPAFKGSAYQVARRRGEIWRRRSLEAAERTVVCWVDSRREDGTLPTNQTEQRAFLNDNIRKLMRLLSAEGQLIAVERDVILTEGTKTWTASAMVEGEVDVQFSEDFADYATVSFDLKFFDPVWYEDAPNVPLTLDTPVSIDHHGEVEAVGMVFNFDGPLATMKVENTTNGVSFQIALSLATGSTARFDTDKMTLTTTVDDVETNAIGALTNAGSIHPMLLLPGTNELVLTASSGTGSATMEWKVPRL